jgi:hypothetical protein
MLKKVASGVLASLRGSTYRSVRLASSLAAALLTRLFEHPEATGVSTPFSEILTIFLRDPSISVACLAGKKSVSFSQTSILHYSGFSITYDEAPVSPT